MARIDTLYQAELPIVEEVETAKGKVKVRDHKIIINYWDAGNPLNTYGEPIFTVGVKMTAALRVFEETETDGKIVFKVRETPQLFGQYHCLSLGASMKDMHDAIDRCIEETIEEIKAVFGEPEKA